MANSAASRVKRSPNPYMLFSKAERANLYASGLTNNVAVSRELGRRWNSMSKEEQKPYIEEADRLKAQHKLDHPDYKYHPKKKVKKVDSSPVEKNKSSRARSAPYVAPNKLQKKEADLEVPATAGYPAGMLDFYPQHPMVSANLPAPVIHPIPHQTTGYQYQPPTSTQGLGHYPVAHESFEHQFQAFQPDPQQVQSQPTFFDLDRPTSNESATSSSTSSGADPAIERFDVFMQYANYPQPTEYGCEYHGLL